MNTIRNTKKGFYTVEAALFLPVFIVSILMLAYMMRVISTGEAVTHILTDEAGRRARDAYAVKVDLLFDKKVEGRVCKQVWLAKEPEICTNWYFWPESGISDLIRIEADYGVKVNLPLDLFGEPKRQKQVVFRAFTGVSIKEINMTKEELEQEKEPDFVWVFPRAGEAYHKETCGYIKVYPREALFSASIQGKYERCSLCLPEPVGTGSLIYYFPTAGTVYHRANCASVEKYVVEMEREEAIEQGYRACLKCGG